MAQILYLDIFSGLSGDMFLGAMLDLGVNFQELQNALSRLEISDYHLHAARQQKNGISGIKFDVHLRPAPPLADQAPEAHDEDHSHPEHDDHHHPHDDADDQEHEHGHEHEHHEDNKTEHHDHDHKHEHPLHGDEHPPQRSFRHIQQLIERCPYSEWVKTRAVAVFQRIAKAEGSVHGLPPEQVHFHEVGAVDSIVDIVGACLALEILGRPRVQASPVVDGQGWMKCQHGRFPVPAPATLAILGARGVPITQCEENFELVTPTGAAILAEFVERFGPMENLVAQRIGYGLGTRILKSRPNVVRAILSEARPETHDWEIDKVAVLETNLDDLNPEILGNFIELALACGALDVYFTPVQMKKNRPAVVLTVLCGTAYEDQFTELILRETSAFGVRRTVMERRKLQREFQLAQTPYGAVTIKLGRLNNRNIQATPEYKSCRELAASAGVPIKQVYEAAIRAIQPPSD